MVVFHPLCPLSVNELQKTREIIEKDSHFSEAIRYISFSLHEPPKELVLSNRVHIPTVNRRVFAILLDFKTTYAVEVVVSLTDECVESWESKTGERPLFQLEELVGVVDAVVNSDLVKQALKKYYGSDSTDNLLVDPWSAGYYGKKVEQERRIGRPILFFGSKGNDYAKPIDSFRPVVDVITKEVIDIEEFEEYPLPPDHDCSFLPEFIETRKDLKPLDIIQKDGPSFTVENNIVEWQKWKMVVGFNQQEGMTLHDICYQDDGVYRSILYRASIGGMVVPYGDPFIQHARKNGFDFGEYGVGITVDSLKRGCECLGVISYIDGHLINYLGQVVTKKQCICIHEEDYNILWKHTMRTGDHQVRRSRRLVVSFWFVAGNYDYGCFWYFYQDGNIEFEVKMTGFLSLGALRPGEQRKHGSMIAEQLYAPNHQHFFTMRLDFAIDGPDNSVCQVDVVAEEDDENSNPFFNAFYAKKTTFKNEKEARSLIDPTKARTWEVFNPNKLNKVGQPVAYKLIPGECPIPYAYKKSYWRKRCGAVDYHVWVTPFKEAELQATGNHPNQRPGDDGISVWSEKDRKIENTDIVLWHTFGSTHIPRPEDYPVMPAAMVRFLLKPNGFFDINPANDVPPQELINGADCCESIASNDGWASKQ